MNKVKVIDGPILDLDSDIAFKGINVKLTEDFVKKNSKYFSLFNPLINFYKCVNVKDFKKTIELNRSNIFHKDFYSPFIGMTIFQLFLEDPESFEPMNDLDIKKEKLLNEAKKRYPIGTKFSPIHVNKEQLVFSNEKCVSNGKFVWDGSIINVDVECDVMVESIPCVYSSELDKWADINSGKTLNDYVFELRKDKIWNLIYLQDKKSFDYKLLRNIASDLNKEYGNDEDGPFVLVETEDSESTPTDIVFNSAKACEKAEEILGEKYFHSIFK